MSESISILWDSVVAGMIADFSNCRCQPTLNRNGFELLGWAVWAGCSDGELLMFCSNQIFLYTVTLAPESNTAANQVPDKKGCKTVSLQFCNTSSCTIWVTSSWFLSGHCIAHWLMLWHLLHLVGCSFSRVFLLFVSLWLGCSLQFAEKDGDFR